VELTVVPPPLPKKKQNVVQLKAEEMKVRELQLKVEQLQRIIQGLEDDMLAERKNKEKLRDKLHTKVQSLHYQLEMSRDGSHPVGSDNESFTADNQRYSSII